MRFPERYMRIDDAVAKLAELREERDNFKLVGPASREMANWLDFQIDRYSAAIDKFNTAKEAEKHD